MTMPIIITSFSKHRHSCILVQIFTELYWNLVNINDVRIFWSNLYFRNVVRYQKTLQVFHSSVILPPPLLFFQWTAWRPLPQQATQGRHRRRRAEAQQEFPICSGLPPAPPAAFGRGRRGFGRRDWNVCPPALVQQEQGPPAFGRREQGSPLPVAGSSRQREWDPDLPVGAGPQSEFR